MATLVTGGCGYIGCHMVLALRDRGLPTVVIDNLATGFAWAIPAEVPFIQGDVGDGALLDQIIREHQIEAIIHFAASSVVPDSVADPLGYYLNNTVKSQALIAAAVRGGVKTFVFSSTAAVYGNPEIVPIPEDAPLKPLSPYGASKAMTEQMLADTAKVHDFHYAALRYFNVAGADPQGRVGQSTLKASHLIKAACETALGQREEMKVFGTDFDTPDGTGVRDYIHVSDLVEAHLDVLEYLRANKTNLIANCGYGRGFSVLEVLAAVERATGNKFPVRYAPRRAGDPAMAVAASDHLRATTGWTPRWNDIDAIVAHALAWERKLKDKR
ncbi:UDP-glucose 4-epimerase [Rhizomicrobium palustre]|uniref:UDP-glucose 4-epimerase n=1 Tax=Rhizomicrobium palustre TaxID=189966 RepID=A0A846MWH8_9PROT|nr:UDP-glucose 4-epimerase GalE [Rhizomicrobium palustre]NIK87390.1 UDP-glucose 4-epimerase [Rhizomicrobium palustre]